MRLTPHGPGFSFIDAVEMLGENPPRLRATKWLDPSLAFFEDHFPSNPLMPGVLLVEMAAQAAGALWGRRENLDASAMSFVLAQVQDFRLKRSARPGDTLLCEAQLQHEFGALAQFAVEIGIRGEESPIASGKITLARASG